MNWANFAEYRLQCAYSMKLTIDTIQHQVKLVIPSIDLTKRNSKF